MSRRGTRMATRSSEISGPEIPMKQNKVAGGDRVSEERQLPCWIGEDGFGDEAFTLSDEFASKGIGNLRGLVGRYVQFARDVVGADERQSRLSKMGMKKSRLASTV